MIKLLTTLFLLLLASNSFAFSTKDVYKKIYDIPYLVSDDSGALRTVTINRNTTKENDNLVVKQLEREFKGYKSNRSGILGLYFEYSDISQTLKLTWKAANQAGIAFFSSSNGSSQCEYSISPDYEIYRNGQLFDTLSGGKTGDFSWIIEDDFISYYVRTDEPSTNFRIVADYRDPFIDECGLLFYNSIPRALQSTLTLTLDANSNPDFYPPETVYAENMGSVFIGHAGWHNNTDRIHKLDFNGDSLEDILIGPQSTGAWYLMLSQGSQFINHGQIFTGYGGWYNNSDRVHIVDFDGDNRDDVLIGPQSNGNWYLLKSNGSNLVDHGVIANAHSGWYNNSDRIWPLDFNGDGKKDILIGPQSNGNWYLLESNGNTFINRGKIADAYSGWYNNSDRIHVMDLNGDAKDDIVIGPKSDGSWYWLESNGSRLVNRGKIASAYAGWYNNSDRLWIADVNGDQKDDIVIGPYSVDGSWSVMRSTGSRLVNDGAWVKALSGWHDNTDRIRVFDSNGDGMDDFLVGPYSVNGDWYILQSTGSSFELDNWVNGSYANWYDNPKQIHTIDINGDLKDDIVLGPDEETGDWYLIQSN